MTRKWQENRTRWSYSDHQSEILSQQMYQAARLNTHYETAHTLRKGQVYSHPDTGETAGYPSHSPLPPLPFRAERNLSATGERTAEVDAQNKDADRAARYMAFPE